MNYIKLLIPIFLLNLNLVYSQKLFVSNTNPNTIPEKYSPSDSINIDMVLVEAGTFQMGDNEGDPDVQPVHAVKIDSFYIGKYEVTQKLWFQIMRKTPGYHHACDNCPIERIRWKTIQKFLLALNKKTGKKYRLPTEAEWEYAARGGNKSMGYKYSGSNNPDEVAWYLNNTKKNTMPVGKKQPNEIGIFDMSGNVFEWCNDRYAFRYYSKSSQSNPQGSTTGFTTVIRGGGWQSNSNELKNSYRSSYAPRQRASFIGFRLALSK